MMLSFLKNKKLNPQKLFSSIDGKHLPLETEIKFEKRKRNQAYFALDYILSRITYFDFFSADAFQIAKYAKYFAQFFQKETVTPELLLLSCFYCNSSLSTFLGAYDVAGNLDKNLIKSIDSKEKTKKFSTEYFTTFLNTLKGVTELNNENIEYSQQVNQIFLKAAELALTRFKNPVITSEIIFLTLMEDKNYVTAKIIKKILGAETEWYLVRYQLIKHLHSQESMIRSDISQNQQYFAYLLKTQLPEKEFDKLLETQSLKKGVSLFRNLLVHEALKINLLEILFAEVKKSIKINNTRKYSS